MNKTKQNIFITNNSKETQRLAESFIFRSEILLRRTKTPRVFALFGELGSGKTTFVQGLAKGLGIKKRIISPTFIIVRNYKIRNKIYDLPAGKAGLRFKNFFHVDLYRLESKNDIEGLGLEEIINDSENIIAIEWAEKIKSLLPKNRYDIRFEHLSQNKRKIIITKINF
ncbi:MAG: tRNA (adenosine(37)-N6)-threonylcarbamoyltransferase complex ATPase subunit type 1 TsaE [Candidatus Levybacteria bacterium RIFCSPHIGHO2_01_FULL_41_15]|nr:MAG: tRNA (adenosine(37)-N6)-threonylcarbamoyltransferase complex ATPase subunit type 1 TsaE [Candidatus Levybacteria bacterium RIFCSPHIGHO2_01_FULL_41_15]